MELAWDDLVDFGFWVRFLRCVGLPLLLGIPPRRYFQPLAPVRELREPWRASLPTIWEGEESSLPTIWEEAEEEEAED